MFFFFCFRIKLEAQVNFGTWPRTGHQACEEGKREKTHWNFCIGVV